MSDLHLGQTMTEAFQFVSFGTAHTFQFDFPPDKVVFNNLTAWTATAGKLPVSTWFRDLTATANAYQQKVIEDTGVAAAFNFLQSSTNGFTVSDLPGGQASSHAAISGITAADPVVITHAAYTFQTNQLVRLTDLGNVGITDNGMGQLNNNRYAIVVQDATHFSLKDVLTGEPVDGTAFTAYVTGGQITLETHVISLNNPQVSPYAVIPYVPNPYRYDPVTSQLTVGTAVMGSSGDVFLVEVYKWGQVTDLGTFLA